MGRRSVLFSPGDQPEMLMKATETAADVVVFDLEDAVAPERRPAARDAIVDHLAAVGQHAAAELCVRINPPPVGSDDLEALSSGAFLPDAIMLPKVTTAADIVAAAEDMRAHLDATVPVYALLERAESIEAAVEIACAEPTTALVFGAEDLSADIGATAGTDLSELSYARQRVVLAARIGGVDPIDTVFTDVQDHDGLREQTARAHRLGYVGKLVIHPAQIDPVHEAFRPSDAELRWARRVIEHAPPDGGVYTVEGEMIDAPIRARAERILRQAGDASKANR